MTLSAQPVRQIVQAGLGNTPDRGILQSVWIEIPGNCDLQCPYCFCASMRNKPDDALEYLAHSPDALADTHRYEAALYVDLIFRPLAERILDWNRATPEERVRGFDCPPGNAETDEWVRGKIAIPGAGEPFHPANRELTMALVKEANALDLHMTIFTTGHWIDDSLARELLPLDVVLLVKCNSRVQSTQNRLVGMPKNHRFFRKREAALERLIGVGFNQPYGEPGTPKRQETRLGIVTSIMRENLEELPDLLRFARRNNIIFDCDTILERGRGSTCAQRLGDEFTRSGFETLQRGDREEFGRHWEISATYVGTACDRFRHHLYVDRRGSIFPCVGCIADQRQGIDPIVLGNVRNGPGALHEAWAAPIMKHVIRPWKYGGPCGTCEHPKTGVCFSCLGRFRDAHATLTRDSVTLIPTVGCWNLKLLPQNGTTHSEAVHSKAGRAYEDTPGADGPH